MSRPTGIKWPVAIRNGRVVTSTGDAHIKQSIAQILLCRRGEYIMNPEFGSAIPDRVFDPVSLLALLWTDAADALQRWERRVDLLSVDAGTPNTNEAFQLGAVDSASLQSGVVSVRVTFRVKGDVEPVELQLPMRTV